ncbi:MAG: hypothetical protein VYB65_12260 [Myxococcota bacterium]|nr:hypothetical protein [Myxococcota bacterium]
MPIQRPLDFFTTMGPGDVLLAGHVQRVEDPSLLQVTPPQCEVDFDSPAPGQFRYLVTLPGKGSLDIAGVCTAFMPGAPDDSFKHIVHSYDRDTRTIEFRLLEETAPGPSAPVETQLLSGERIYFWVHLYDSTPDPINLVIEAP